MRDSYDDIRDGVYYRIQYDYKESKKISVCTLQADDEHQYDRSMWITDRIFRSEEAACQFMHGRQDSDGVPDEVSKAIKEYLKTSQYMNPVTGCLD